MKPAAFLFSDFLAYVRNPYFIATEQPDGTWRDRLRLIWTLWRTKFVIGFSLAIVMAGVQLLVSRYTGLTFDYDINLKGWSFVLAVVVIAPVMEEGLFRGLLRPNATQLTLIAMLLMMYVAGHTYGEWPVGKGVQVGVMLALLIGLPVLVYRTLKSPRRQAGLERFWRAHFRLLFYLVAAGFGLAHLGNYQHLTGWHYLMAPLLTLPQLFSGFYLGYVRMKYGIWYGVVLHAIWNAIPASMTVAYLLTH